MMNGLGDLSGLQTAWFDAVLKDDPERLRNVPPVLLYFMGENQWRGFDELPSPRSHRSWFGGADRSLRDTPGSGGSVKYDYDPLDPVPTAGGAAMIHGVFPAGPAMQHAVEARADVLTFTTEAFEEPVTLFGEVSATFFAEGHRRMVPITGGTVRGPALNGRVLPGGADYQFLRGPTLTELDARYVLETDDGHRVFVHNTALRHGSARDIELLNSGAAVDPSRIYFRCWPRLTTASPALEWLNTRLMLGTGVREPGRVVIRIFTID